MLQFKHKIIAIRVILFSLLSLIFIFLLVTIILTKAKDDVPNRPINSASSVSDESSAADVALHDVVAEPEAVAPEYPKMSNDTKAFDPKFVVSEYAVLLDVQSNNILAQKSSNTRIYPASLTKMMTLLVAVDHIKNYNDTFTISYDILAPLVKANASRAGFSVGEPVRMIDLLYAAILPSGADATVGLAVSLAGSEDNFAKLMNDKAKELGLRDTHFVNTSGLHNPNHYSTVTDMAVIMKAVLSNSLCKTIISAQDYTTAPTAQHPNGIKLYSDTFRKMYGTEVENVVISGGKTGYTDQSGNCLATYAVKNGKEYIAVTAKGSGPYRPIYDSFAIYGKYLP